MDKRIREYFERMQVGQKLTMPANYPGPNELVMYLEREEVPENRIILLKNHVVIAIITPDTDPAGGLKIMETVGAYDALFINPKIGMEAVMGKAITEEWAEDGNQLYRKAMN